MVKKCSIVTTHKLALSWDSDDDVRGLTVPRTKTHRHVVYASTQETFSHHTSYLSVPASPKKHARVSPHDSSGYLTPADMAPSER